MSSDLVKEWQQGDKAYRNTIATAAQGNDFFESDKEVSARILNNLHAQLQLITDQKLVRPLGRSEQKAYGKKSESWRSRLSLQNITTNVGALQQLYRAAFAPRLTDQALAKHIESAFENTILATKQINVPLYEAVTDAKNRPKVEKLLAETTKLMDLIAGPLSKAIDIPLGFNSLDGD